jgi:hypothetical protein
MHGLLTLVFFQERSSVCKPYVNEGSPELTIFRLYEKQYLEVNKAITYRFKIKRIIIFLRSNGFSL